MTGLEILQGLSYVDAKYIQEAENAELHRNTPWLKVLSVAACLCILFTGAYAYSQLQTKGATESCVEHDAAAVEEAAVEAAEPAETAAAASREDSSVTGAEGASAESKETAAGELQHIPYATLRIIRVADDHWVAVVEEVPDEPVALEVGMQVTVVIDTDRVTEEGEEDNAMYGGDPLPEEGRLAKIENGAYDAEANTLYVAAATVQEGE